MSTIFTKIINREIPGQFVYEDDVCVVLMDKFPAVPGQTLVVSKAEVDYLFDLPEETYQHMFAVAKRVTKASDKAFGAIRTCLLIEGFEVPHAHIKLYPKTEATGLMGEAAGAITAADDETLNMQAELIKAAL